MQIKYRRPAEYDQELALETVCSLVTPGKVEHIYTLKRSCDGVVLAEGATTLACVSAEGKIRRVPEFMQPAPR